MEGACKVVLLCTFKALLCINSLGHMEIYQRWYV